MMNILAKLCQFKHHFIYSPHLCSAQLILLLNSIDWLL